MPRVWVTLVVASLVTVLGIRSLHYSILIAIPLFVVMLIFIVVAWPTLLHWLPDVAKLSPRLQINTYLRWLIKESRFRLMEGQIPSSSDSSLPFEMLFCDCSSFVVDERPISLSKWMSHTSVGQKAYAGILLGRPGAGKTVTLQAVLLSCANSAFMYHLIPHISRVPVVTLSWVQNRLRWLVDRTWLFGTPPYVPFFVTLRGREADIRAYMESNKNREAADKLLWNLLGGTEVDQKQFEWLLSTGRIALLLDGLDELSEEKVRVALLQFASAYFHKSSEQSNLLLITCRKGSLTLALREELDRSFNVVQLGDLTAPDKNAIVRQLIRAQWAQADSLETGIVSEGKRRLKNLPQRSFRKKMGGRKGLRDGLIENLVEEIVERLPRAYLSWQPTSNPLSLRRMAGVLLSRSGDNLISEVDDSDGRLRWRLESGGVRGSVLDYATLIEEDLLAYIERRKMFCEMNGLEPRELLGLYGELAYLRATPRGIPLTDIKTFVKDSSRNRKAEQELDTYVSAFLSPNILTELDSESKERYYGFRDEESQYYAMAFYMVSGSEVWQKIDAFIARSETLAQETATFQMVSSKLKGDLFAEFVSHTNYFARTDIIQSLMVGLIGSRKEGAVSKKEGQALLTRALHEVGQEEMNGRLIRLWLLIRHLIFERRTTEGAFETLKSILQRSSASAYTRAQALLTASELAVAFDGNGNHDALKSLLKDGVRDSEMIVSSCAALALSLLSAEYAKTDEALDKLTVVIPAGELEIGSAFSDLNPPHLATLNSFRLARFPVLRFEAQLEGLGSIREVAPGNLFKPVVNVDFAGASRYAAARGARLPRSSEFEVVAAYVGANGKRRQYPWGENFSEEHSDICHEEREFRRILGDLDDALPVAMKPCLGTPVGIYDLVANVYQMTGDLNSGPDGSEVLLFGVPSSCLNDELFSCDARGQLQVERASRSIGFRLAWNIAEGQRR